VTASETIVTGVRFERRRAGDARGIGVAAPRLSWITETDAPGWRQIAYEVELGGETSGRIESDASVLVPWPAPPLVSRQRSAVRVRVWGSDGGVSPWSAPAEVDAGLLEPGDWTARFVAPAEAPSLLRRAFVVPGTVERARLHVTALGVYEVEINGRTVGDHVLAPGWTSYDHRLRVETFDVTGLVRQGDNALGAWLAEGWYGGKLGWGGGRRVYGDQLAILAQLEVTQVDGSTLTVATAGDGSWRSHPGPIVASSIYGGETYDARSAQPGWSAPGFDDASWKPVTTVVDQDLGTLVARTGPPVRRTEVLEPVEVTTSPSGRTIFDFGQNLVGRLRIVVSGDAGTTVTLRHAEVLHDGELCTELQRLAEATDRYTLRGDGPETWEPRFTFHGFRYAEVDGPLPDAMTAVVCHSDMERTGWFSCSDERVTQLHDNVVWGMRGNFLDIPTDCPQRDERLGWTGDINVFSPTAAFLYDCDGFLASWLADLAAEQQPDGVIPLVVPNVLEHVFPTAVWGDAAVVVPWVLYQRFGDVDVLRDQYTSMRAWVDHVVGLAGDNRLWDTGFQFADWLDPAAPEDKPHAGRTDPHLVATAAFCHSLDVLSEAAGVIGVPDDAARYAGVAAEVRRAFADEYVAPSGLVVSDSQTAYALALRYALLPSEEQRARAGARLAKLVRRADHRIATGFVGTPIVCDALCEAGEAATAYQLLTQEECPSWLYPVLHGATTVWERWDAIKPDGTLNGTRMNSFNHYALGAVADWLHRTVGGLAPAAPAYRRQRIAPVPGGGMSWASSRHRTPYGLAESSWRIEGDTIEVMALVPPNTTAQVVLPGASGEPIEVGSGRHHWRVPFAVAEEKTS
jgi:alpha-L-rhamnosidase